jgi:ABC-2 type transport system permease protein
MKARALAVRILHQLRHDRRTLALMMAAPLLLLTRRFDIFETSASTPTVAIINAPAGVSESLEASNVTVVRMREGQAYEALEAGEIVAFINVSGGKASVKVDGSQTGDTRAALAAVQVAGLRAGHARSDLQAEVEYLYSYEDSSMFDTYGAAYIGFIIFFFTFLVAGISFLQERTSGTLEKLLSMPIKRWEIVVGYVMGFGTVTVLQSFLISWFSIYILDLALVGSFALVLLITLLAAMVALTFGIMCSTAANSEFQMMQFIPVVIIPQIFFSGLFDLSSWLEIIEKTVPLYYITDALTMVMVKGAGIDVIAVDLAVITGFCVFFMALNTRLLRKYRRI